MERANHIDTTAPGGADRTGDEVVRGLISHCDPYVGRHSPSESCAHAPVYESVAEFNEKTLAILREHTD